MLGAAPAHAQAREWRADGFARDPRGGEPLRKADLGRKVQRPQAGLLAEGAGAVVQQRT